LRAESHRVVAAFSSPRLILMGVKERKKVEEYLDCNKAA
jgi:hypothetical protein